MSIIRVTTDLAGQDLTAKAETLYPAAKTALGALSEGTCKGSEWTGWFRFPNRSGSQLLNDIHGYKETIDLEYDCVLVIGIGGSYLGTRAVADVLGHDFPLVGSTGEKPILYCGHEMSERSLEQLLQVVDQRKPLVNIISKSGTTTEPGAAFRLLRHSLQEKYGAAEASKRIVATTDPEKGALRTLAREQGWQTFDVPADVGGRYSVHTAVGLLPLALAGYDAGRFVQGAADLFDELESAPDHHPALQYAALRNAAYQSQKSIEVLTLQGNRYRSFGEWWKQLYGESEGKQQRGLFPSSLILTTDLHSMGQYLQDGQRNILETFLTFDEQALPTNLQIPKVGDNHDQLDYLAGKRIAEINEAARQATAMAHEEGGVPSLNLQCRQPDAHTLGALVAFFEVACAVSGAVLGVNPFDQPGVESYKKKMFALLGKPGA